MLFTLSFWFALATAVASPAPQASSTPAIQADVLIGAGHEGRPQSCPQFPQHKCNLGTPGERELTPVVADEAARILRAHGVTVLRVPADFVGHYAVEAAAFIHFDGTEPVCRSGASIGYHRVEDKPGADAWHALYAKYFPFRFQPDNFTLNLSQYYGFRQVTARDSALVIEFGELSCPAQRAWLAPRAKWDGALLAHFLSARIGKGKVPDPGPFRR